MSEALRRSKTMAKSQVQFTKDNDNTPEKAKLYQEIYDRMIKPKLLSALKEKKDNLN